MAACHVCAEGGGEQGFDFLWAPAYRGSYALGDNSILSLTNSLFAEATKPLLVRNTLFVVKKVHSEKKVTPPLSPPRGELPAANFPRGGIWRGNSFCEEVKIGIPPQMTPRVAQVFQM